MEERLLPSTKRSAQINTIVTGASGQLGSALRRLVGGQEGWMWLTSEDIDLAAPATIRQRLQGCRFDRIINCAAMTQVDACERDPERARQVNAEGVRTLAEICRERGAVMVQVSTDYVFGGHEERGYREDAPPSPINAYGRSKLAGEQFVRQLVPHHFIIRTSAVFGRRADGAQRNFVEAILSRARQGQPLRVVADQVTCPTLADDLAARLVTLIDRGETGVYHVTNAGRVSWHGFAVEILHLAGIEATVEAITADEYPSPTRRPRFAVLLDTKSSALDLPPPPSWTEALKDYLRHRDEALR